MAAVTLKDLMDPLSKIAAATQATNEKLDAFVAMATGDKKAYDIEQAIYDQLEQQTDVLRRIEQTLLRSDSVHTENLARQSSFAFKAARDRMMARLFATKDSKNLEAIAKASASKGGDGEKGGKTGKVKGDGAQALKDLGMGAALTGKAMLIWSLVPKKAVNKFLDFVVNSFERFESFDVKKVQKGVNALDAMGGAIMKFAKALALATPLILIGLIGLPILIPTLFIMGGVFYLLGSKKFSQRIRKGSRALDIMGDALLSFGIGLAAFALASMIVIMQPAVLLGMVLSLTLIGGAVALLGTKKIAKNVRRGAGVLSLLGLGVAVFGLGYAIFASAFPSDVGIVDILLQGAAILAIGVSTAIVGKFGIANIAQGALSLALNGLGLLVFNLGYVPFADAVKGMSMGDIGIQSGVLLAVGGIMALAGLAVAASVGAVLLGPALYAAAGGALSLLAPGLQAMKDLDYSEQDSKDLATTLGAVAMAFSGIDPEAGVFGMIGGLFTRVLQSGGGLAAAAMYAAAGGALQTLSKGLGDFQKLDFTEEDSKQLGIALGSVSGAFAQAGGEPASPGGLFGAIFGNTFSPNATERGIKSVMRSGDALTEITKGLAAFLDLKNKYGLDASSFAEGGYLNTAVTDTLTFVSTAFATIGGMEEEDGWGPFSWDENLVEKGIDAVKGAGRELKAITDGLAAFLDLKVKYKLGPEAFQDGGYLQVAVKDSLGFVSKAFATIGGEETEDSWGPFRWDENKVEKGVDAVKGAGAELTNIANGLKSFQELVERDIDFSVGGSLATAVTNSLTFVAEAFKVIGGMEETDGWFVFSWDENLVEKGVEAVQGAGAELTNIANGLISFQDLIDKGVDFSTSGGLASAVKNTVTFVGDAFMAIAAKKKTKSTFFGLISWDENQVAKGIENVKGAGQELKNIAEGISTFAGIDSPATVAKGVTSIFNSIADAFTAQYSRYGLRSELDHFGRWVEDLADAAGSGDLAKAGTDLEKIAAAINSVDIYKAESMAALFSGASELSSNRMAYRDLYRAVQDIRDLLSEQSGGGGQGPLPEAPSTAPAGSGNSNAAMTKLNSTLGRLERTMSQLPASIQSIKIVVPD